MSGWDHLYSDRFWSEWAQRSVLEVTLGWIRALRRGGAVRVYDMGCGLGRHAVCLAAEGFSVVASDVSRRALEATRRACTSRGLRAHVLQADMTAVPCADECFDGVLSIGVLEHSTRRGMEQAISEILRVLRPGGRLLASFAARTRWLPRDEPGMDMLEDNTLRCYGPEQSLHHLVDEGEVRELLDDFAIRSIDAQTEEYRGVSGLELFASAEKPVS
jgi:SAM-dependent methyltransferase